MEADRPGRVPEPGEAEVWLAVDGVPVAAVVPAAAAEEVARAVSPPGPVAGVSAPRVVQRRLTKSVSPVPSKSAPHAAQQ